MLQLILIGLAEFLEFFQTPRVYKVHDAPQIHPGIFHRRPGDGDAEVIFHRLHAICETNRWIFDFLRFIEHHD